MTMVKTRTKTELKRSHDAMARFLIELCRFSDSEEVKRVKRMPRANRNYKRARQLIRAAGFKYERKP